MRRRTSRLQSTIVISLSASTSGCVGSREPLLCANGTRHPAGTVAWANQEAVRAWDTVLYERWKQNRKVFVGALDEVTQEVFDRAPPPEGGRCIDIGCGFGETTQRLAELVGNGGFVLGTDSSPRFIDDARREADEAGVENVDFEVRCANSNVGSHLRLRLLTHGDAVLRRTRPGHACDSWSAQARWQARQGLLASQGREPVLGADRTCRGALFVAPRRARSRHLRAGTILPGQPRDMPRHS